MVGEASADLSGVAGAIERQIDLGQTNAGHGQVELDVDERLRRNGLAVPAG